MATNFPAAFDNNTTLGGPFIDVAPPADPLRNIAATSRNNLNDTVFAIEQRIGFLGNTTTSTLDWATPNGEGGPVKGCALQALLVTL